MLPIDDQWCGEAVVIPI